MNRLNRMYNITNTTIYFEVRSFQTSRDLDKIICECCETKQFYLVHEGKKSRKNNSRI